MKVVQVIDVRWFNACADFAIKQALGLKLCGHEVLLLANPNSPPAVKARESGLDVCVEIDFAKIGRIFGSVRRLKALARDFNADIIFAHRGESHLMAALAAGVFAPEWPGSGATFVWLGATYSAVGLIQE